MSHVLSSPSRQVIDPLIYSADPEKKAGPKTHMPSWTPLAARTVPVEMLHSSTPNSSVLPAFYRQQGEEFGLNLTPFLTHNLALNTSQSFTPFYDKSAHMLDFFIDSPIRLGAPGDTITPSKFAVLPTRLSSLKREKELATPSKVLADLTNTRKKPLFETPAKAPVSLPSTVIMLSATRLPDKTGPASPTPSKRIEETELVMGVFEDKPREKKRKKPLNNRFQIVFTDMHTLMNNPKKKKKSLRAPAPPAPPAPGPAPVHGYRAINLSQPVGHPAGQPLVNHLPMGPLHPYQGLAHPYSFSSQDYNTTGNSSKEFSIGNTTANTTHPHAYDHHSFELANGSMLTPNRKYLLELFERHSPHLYVKQEIAKPSLREMNMMMSTPQHQHTRPVDMSPRYQNIPYPETKRAEPKRRKRRRKDAGAG